MRSPAPPGIHSNASAAYRGVSLLGVLSEHSRLPELSGECRTLVLGDQGTKIVWRFFFFFSKISARAFPPTPLP